MTLTLCRQKRHFKKPEELCGVLLSIVIQSDSNFSKLDYWEDLDVNHLK